MRQPVQRGGGVAFVRELADLAGAGEIPLVSVEAEQRLDAGMVGIAVLHLGVADGDGPCAVVAAVEVVAGQRLALAADQLGGGEVIGVAAGEGECVGHRVAPCWWSKPKWGVSHCQWGVSHLFIQPENGYPPHMRLLLIFLTMLWVVPARAQAPDLFVGNGFLEACSAGDPVSRTACTQYALGMSQMLLALEAGHFIKQQACTPEAITGNQKRDILLKFLRDNPCPPDRALPPAEKRM